MRIISIILLSLILVSGSFVPLISNEGPFDTRSSASTSEVISTDPTEKAFDATRATRYVDDSGGQTYRTIQSAVNAANPGDTIFKLMDFIVYVFFRSVLLYDAAPAPNQCGKNGQTGQKNREMVSYF